MILAGDSDAAEGAQPLRGGRRGEFALTAQRGRGKRKRKREEKEEGPKRGRKAWWKLVQWPCVSWRLPVSRTRLPIYHPR